MYIMLDSMYMYVTMSTSTGLYPNLDLWTANKLQLQLQLCEIAYVQVVFVMTGDCGDSKHRGYQVFEEIASTSSGQVYHINKTDVEEVCKLQCPSGMVVSNTCACH
jgi:hypothetical protein